MSQPSIAAATVFRLLARGFALAFAALTLAGCATAGTGSPPAATPARPLTHSNAALECWMQAEKEEPSASLDQRSAFVTRCIDAKMKGTN